MKTSLRSFASLRFNFFFLASRAVGDKWADPAGRALPVSMMRAGRPRSLFLGALGVLAVNSSSFAATTWSQTWTVSTAIPDNDDVGFADTRSVSIPGIDEIVSITVNLNFIGGWNGDLYTYLVHGSGFAVLLNRPGRSLVNPDGSAAFGMSITIADSASMDIHTAIPMSGGSVSGTYQPDGRETDPLAVLDTSPRTAMLADFTSLDPNGDWTLFIADQSAGETSTLQSWSLNITAVPEPSAALMGVLGMAFLLRKRRDAKSHPSSGKSRHVETSSP